MKNTQAPAVNARRSPSTEQAQRRTSKTFDAWETATLSAFGSGQNWTASEKRPLQRKKASEQAQGKGVGGLAPSAGSPMPSEVQSQMEGAFGADFGDVRVHVGDAAPAMGAQAFAQGDDVHFAPGKYNPQSASGKELLGHELAHVVQQREGRVSSPQGKGAPVVADAGLEAEADRAGAAIAQGEPVPMVSSRSGAAKRAPSGVGLQLKGERPGALPTEAVAAEHRDNQVSPENPPPAPTAPGLAAEWQESYQRLAHLAREDGKTDLLDFFLARPGAVKNAVMARLEGAGLIPTGGPSKWTRFVGFFGAERYQWGKFAKMVREAEVELPPDQTTQQQGGGSNVSAVVAATGLTGKGSVLSGQGVANTAQGLDAQASGNLTAGLGVSHGAGALAGGLGLMSTGVYLANNVAAARDGSTTNSQRAHHGMGILGNLASAERDITNSVDTVGRLATNNSGVIGSGALGTALGVGAVVGGAVEMGRGIRAAVEGHRGVNAMQEIRQQTEGSQLDDLAENLEDAHDLNRTEGAVTAAKGATMVVGGALLLALGVSNPAGAIILGLAGAVAGTMAAYKWWRQEKKKARTVDRYFANELEAVRRENPRMSGEKARAKVLQSKGFASATDFYGFYRDTYGTYLNGLLTQGVRMPQEARSANVDLMNAKVMVESLGLAVDFDRPRIPTAPKIAKKI